MSGGQYEDAELMIIGDPLIGVGDKSFFSITIIFR